ncbi:SDR family NAD(P)-dependent oxidoreductase [Paracoccus marcusii]|uniref:SDR family NAD(P)-dependent oxidoreductase n=1 Tax=Paracoccus marcusii TaxID=59779 RepID=UPI002ECFF0AE|nr:SDR family NAD(P)-dependent oxidoreductase [Paracoccus marcusii]
MAARIARCPAALLVPLPGSAAANAGWRHEVLITGAGSGIGRALAIQADRQGHGVILVGRRAGPLEQTAAGCATRWSCPPMSPTPTGAPPSRRRWPEPGWTS